MKILWSLKFLCMNYSPFFFFKKKSIFWTFSLWSLSFQNLASKYHPVSILENFALGDNLICRICDIHFWLSDSWLSPLANMGSNDKAALLSSCWGIPQREGRKWFLPPAETTQEWEQGSIHWVGCTQQKAALHGPFSSLLDFPHSLGPLFAASDSHHLCILFLIQSSLFFPKHDTAQKFKKRLISSINVKLGAKS